MSKSFPALRLHGNKEAAVRHIKRGLHELFRVQELQKLMGVPTLKRTIEVSEFTRITVEIHRKQTFVHIYSEVEQLPEVVLIPEGKDEEVFGCPSAFIIRQIQTIGPPYKHEGHIIAYNHRNRVWQVVSFKDKYGTPFPEAGNVGWFHIPNNSDLGYYNKCDVITWRGENPVELSTTEVAGFTPTSEYLSGLNFKTGSFFFQGREFSGPFNRPILGVCMLRDDDGHDYFYAHTVTSGTNPSTPPDTYAPKNIYIEHSHKIRVSQALAGGESWISVNSVVISDEEELMAAVGMGQEGDNYDYHHWAGPYSTSYIDENGFSYVIREHNVNPETTGLDIQGIEGSTGRNFEGGRSLIRWNLRDMSWEVLSTPKTHACQITCYINSDSYVTTPFSDAPGINFSEGTGNFGAYWQAHNLGRPYVFHVFAGTQDLYYMALEHNYTASSNYTKTGSIPPASSSSGSIYAYSNIVLFKNHKRVKTIPFVNFEFFNQTKVVPVDESTSIRVPIASQGAITDTWIYQFHPEVGVENYLETRSTSSPDTTLTLTMHHQGDTQLIGSSYYPGTITTPETTYFFLDWWLGTKGPHGSAYRNGYIDVRTVATNRISYGNGGDPHFSVDMTPWLLPLQIGSQYETLEQHPVYALEAKWGSNSFYDVRPEYRPFTNQGSVTNFYLHYNKDADNPKIGRLYQTFATHRPIEGQIPYLWLTKKIYPRSEYVASLNPVKYTPGDFAMSDDDPSLGNPNPYYFFDGSEARNEWWLWTKPPGFFRDPTKDPDDESHHWNDNEWELVSNFISADKLNKMTREIGNNFFDIGII